MKKNKIILTLVLCFVLVFSIRTSAQIDLSSPYSRYGLGELNTNNKAFNMSMGGINQGLQSNRFVNNLNPASYAGFDTLSFVFNGGFNGYWKTIKNKTLSQNTDYFTISDLSLGFPITKWLKIGAGMSPYSTLGYYLNDENYSDDFGKYYHLYEGEGGLNKTFSGFSVELFDRLSIGANFNYVWGNLIKSKAVVFPDSSFMRHTQSTERTNVRGYYFDFGMQYRQPLNKEVDLILGASYTPSQKLSAHLDQIAYNYSVSNIGLQTFIDTILFVEGAKKSITLPQSFGTGFTIQKPGRFRFGADFTWQEWSKYKFIERTDKLANSFRVALGAEVTPEHTTLSNYFSFVNYRFGMRYGKSYININETQLNEFGISFGLGLPLMRTKSVINLGFEYGRRGTIDNNLLREDFFRVTLGVSINEIWFVKRKFD